jgi:cyclopropane fatty-acyl-phospholipid synthase-like methyltransferase
MATSIYISDTYVSTHPSWHTEDSAWKASKVLGILTKNRIAPETIVEIGCGAGEILCELQRRLSAHCSFQGFEISPHAFSMCSSRSNDRLSFAMSDGLHGEAGQVDLALAMDVVEHVDDYPEFLRMMRKRARYCVFHIPLDLSMLSIATGLPERVRASAGHLHYFTKALALAAIREANLEVVDWTFTRPAIERPNKSWRGRLARLPRIMLASLSPALAATVLGGFSILVLARNPEANV